MCCFMLTVVLLLCMVVIYANNIKYILNNAASLGARFERIPLSVLKCRIARTLAVTHPLKLTVINCHR